MEQRKVFRYAIVATATFEWQDEGGMPQRSEGITRDMSGSGAFIYAAVGPTEHVPARIEFELPPLEEATGGSETVPGVSRGNGRALS